MVSFVSKFKWTKMCHYKPHEKGSHLIVLVRTRVRLRFWHLHKRTATRGENEWEFDLKGIKHHRCENTFIVLLRKPFLCCLGSVFWVIVMLEDLSTTHLQSSGWEKEVPVQDFTVHGSVLCPLNAVTLFCTLIRKAAFVSASVFDWGDGVDVWWSNGFFWPQHCVSGLL